MKLYAYVRVSTRQQRLKRQIENIMSASGGAYAGAMFFSDKFTGSTLDRPEWNRLYKRLQPGGTIVFDSVSRLSRDAEDGAALYEELYQKGINLAEFSESRGCPVGFRGLTGNLYLSYLLGLAAVDPMELGLRWEGCLGLDGTRAPMFALNVAGGLLEEMAAYLGELLPGYDPDAERPAIRLCPHALMDRVWEARQAGGVPAVGDVLSDGSLVARAYHSDVAGIPVLGDLEGFQDLARRLEPETFSDMVKIMGLCLAPEIRFQAERLVGQPDRFQRMVGTREDVYDLCVRHGVGEDDAFQAMRQESHGRLSPEYRDTLAARGLPGVSLETLDAAEYLYPRGQCADYLYWALALLRHQTSEVDV